MFVDWKNQYCQNDYTTQGNLKVNATSLKLPVAFFTELEQQKKKSQNLYGDMKDPEEPKHLEKEKWNWRNQVP